MSILVTVVDDFGIVADGLARSTLWQFPRGEVGIPGEAAEGVEVGHGERGAEPVVAAHAGDADHAAERLCPKSFAINNVF